MSTAYPDGVRCGTPAGLRAIAEWYRTMDLPQPPPMSIDPIGPDRERALIDAAKDAYIRDVITLDEFSRRVDDILSGYAEWRS